MTTNTLQSRITQFLATCPSNFDYPLGGDISIPLNTEIDLVNYTIDGGVLTPMIVNEIRSNLSRSDSYSMAIFALRMSALAVERNDPKILKGSFWALIVDNDSLSWRDVLVSLSIVEDCYSRIGGEINSLIDLHLPLATERRTKTIVDGYLKRSTEMRHVETMGYIAVHNKINGTLRYIKSL